MIKTGWQIRPLRETDQEFLWEMLYEAIYVLPGLQPPPFEIVYGPTLAHYAKDWGKPGDVGFVAVGTVKQRLAGACWLRCFNEKDKGYGFIDNATPELSIALRPDYRGQGIGGTLLNATLEAIKSSYGGVSLSVGIDNPALRLYQCNGFVEVAKDANGTLTMLKKF